MANTNNTSLPTGYGQQIGGSGTYFYNGYITAEEYSRDLQGKYGLQVYNVMRHSDATVRAALNIVKWPILGADWSLEPASNEEQDLKIAKHANFEFFNRNISFHEIMRENLNFLDMGHAVAEKVLEKAAWNGAPYIGFAGINSRKQRSILKWKMDDGNDGITQILPTGKSVNIPREKLLVVVNDQEGENYAGFPLLRYAYKPWYLKERLEIMNAVALENQGMGVPYIKKLETIDESEIKKLRERIRQQRINEESYIEFPSTVEVGYLDMKGQTTKEIIPTIEYQDRQILLSVLGQFLLLGQQAGSGSRAVSQDHSRLFVKALEAVARQYQYAFQRDVINYWVDLNYSNLPNGYPKLSYGTIGDEDVTETATAVNSLMQVQALHPDRDMENRLRNMLNLPPLSEEDYENFGEDITSKKAAAEEMEAKMAQQPASVPPAGGPADANADNIGLPDEGDKVSGEQNDQSLSIRKVLGDARYAQKQLLSLYASQV